MNDERYIHILNEILNCYSFDILKYIPIKEMSLISLVSKDFKEAVECFKLFNKAMNEIPEKLNNDNSSMKITRNKDVKKTEVVDYYDKYNFFTMETLYGKMNLTQSISSISTSSISEAMNKTENKINSNVVNSNPKKAKIREMKKLFNQMKKKTY